MTWLAKILYTDGSCVPFSFEDWDDFQEWLLRGPEHDWSVVVKIVIRPA